MIYALGKKSFAYYFSITLRLRVEGTENIPKDGPLVIASNHLSLLDPPVLGTAQPVRFILWPSKGCSFLS